jgi:BlaI family transcriptional regulator, penicillinase repressor
MTKSSEGTIVAEPLSRTAPTERELQALKILWRRREATVREICDDLQQAGQQLAYTTVLSLMQVMEQKGLVGHTTVGKVYSYFALAEEQPTLGSMARTFLDNVFDGAVDQYLLHALGDRRISPAELRRLEELLAEARKQRKPRNGETP